MSGIEIKKYKLIIFDVDGTLVEPKSGATFRKSADDWQYLPKRVEKCQELWAKGVKIALATNQGGVAFGYLDYQQMRVELEKTAQGVHAALTLICFTHPKATIEEFRRDSDRRKPGPGMLLEAIKMSGESREDTLMVGDREEDKLAAEAASCSFSWAWDYFGDGPIIV